MADRRVKVIFSAEIQNFKSAMDTAATATQKAKTASEAVGKASDKAAEDVRKLGLAHHAAAKAAGLQYDNTGQLVTMNGKAVSSQQAAAHGLQTFSKEAYLAGRAAVAAGEDAESAAKKAADAEAHAAAAIEKRREAMENVGAVAMTAGALTLAGVGLAVKSYADFDKQMSSVDAATHETAGNMQLLRDAAVDAGADTAFSAVDAARGIEELAKAGVSTKDILAGGLAGSLALAAAGSLDVGQAAEIAASALVQFKLSGDKVPHVADLLAAAAGKAQGSVEDMGAALNQSGLVAASTGLTIEETTGALAAFASAGLIGSDAGTSFKTMLMSLNPNSAAAATLMEELGIKAYDAEGSFIGMSEYAGVLQGALKGMGDEQRNATLKTLFGSDAVRAANVLYENGASGINKWESAVNDAGFAADTAARMQNNLAGDLEKLGGSFDTALIKSGSGANEVLRGLVQGLESVVDAVGKVPAPVLGAATGVAALAGGALLLGGTLISVIPKIAATKLAIETLAPAGGKAAGVLGALGKAALPAAAALTAVLIVKKLGEDMLPAARSTQEMTSALIALGKGAKTVDEALDKSTFSRANNGVFGLKEVFGVKLTEDIDTAGDAIARLNDLSDSDKVNDFMNGFIDLGGKLPELRKSLEGVDTAMADLTGSGNAELAAESFKKIADEASKKGVALETTAKSFPQYIDSLRKLANESEVTLTEQELLDWAMGKIPAKMDAAAKSTEGQAKAAEVAAVKSEELAKALEEIGLNADGSVANLDKFTTALVNAGLLTLSARDATAKFDEALDGLDAKIRDIMATEQAHGGVLNESKTDLDIYSEAGREANNVLADMTQKGFAAAQAMAANGASMPEVQSQLGKTYDAMVTTARGFGLGKEEAEALTRSILHIPPGVDINTWMADEAKRMAEATKSAIDGIPKDVQVKITTTEHKIKILETQTRGSADPSMVALDPSAHQTGGRLPGFTDGGQLPMSGPGTDRRDGFLGISSAGVPLARVDAGEWIINRGSSGRYNRELAAINAGTFPKLPGYANGARMGREYSAQSLGYAPYTAGAPVHAGPTFGDVTINEQSDPVATFHEFTRRTRALGT